MSGRVRIHDTSSFLRSEFKCAAAGRTTDSVEYGRRRDIEKAAADIIYLNGRFQLLVIVTTP